LLFHTEDKLATKLSPLFLLVLAAVLLYKYYPREIAIIREYSKKDSKSTIRETVELENT